MVISLSAGFRTDNMIALSDARCFIDIGRCLLGLGILWAKHNGMTM
jgi:hypothetical protein